MHKAKILIVDDEALMREMLRIALDERFVVAEAESGEATLAMLERDAQALPDLILLDIEMLQLDGYETCRRLRSAGYRMPVVFVSSHVTLDERLQAFDAGGDDFISKPFDAEELSRKVDIAVERYLRTQGIEAVVQQVLYDVGEKGVLLAFLREAIHITDYAELVQRLLQSVGEFGVRCNVQIRCDEGTITLTPAGEPTPLELSIMEHAVSLDHGFRFGRRLVINYHFITLLILDLPDDAERVRHIADYVEMLVESAEAVVETIAMRRESASRAETLMVASAESYSAIEELREAQQKQQSDTRLLLQQLIEEVERTYVYLGLTENQEEAVSTSMRTGADKIIQLFDQWAEYDSKFEAVLASLRPKGSSNNDVWL
jgi:DNA-binding response OmpR family regulator